MRKFSISSLTLLIALAACADHSGSITSVVDGPQAPINQPDTGVFQPGVPTTGGSAAGSTASSGQENGGGSSGSGTGESGGGQAGQGAGAGGETGGGANTGENGGGGNGPGSGPSGGEPVPEPSTLLLVGSGLAGIALLRRRRAAGLPQNARD